MMGRLAGLLLWCRQYWQKSGGKEVADQRTVHQVRPARAENCGQHFAFLHIFLYENNLAENNLKEFVGVWSVAGRHNGGSYDSERTFASFYSKEIKESPRKHPQADFIEGVGVSRICV